MEDSPQQKGGRARSEKLSREQRTEIARQGGLARGQMAQRDMSTIPWAVAEGELRIGEASFRCAVLENGKRVLTQDGVLQALGRSRTAKGGEGASVDEGPSFLRAKNLKPFVSNELEVSTRTIIYKPKLGGYTPNKGWLAIAYGQDAEVLPAILDVFVRAQQAGVLHHTQSHIAEQAVRLLGALPKIAMVALVDEATGYQQVRAHDELQQILSAYILPEHRPWLGAVLPIEFTKEVYRVYGWSYSSDNRGPRYASKLIRKLIYEPMPSPVLPELDRVNPPNAKWQRKRKHHQHLTDETGLAHFKSQLAGVTLLRATP
jgi:P63C domain